MSRRLPPLNALKAFEAAARHLSFTKAAEELFVTQAAISHQIKSLEDFLGLKLFLRRNRSLLLTDEGQSYFQDIRQTFIAMTESTERLIAKGAKGTLTVSMQPSFAIHWFIPRLSLFTDLHPEIDVRVKAVDADDDTLVDDVDVAIYYGNGHWPGLQLYKLHTEYRIPVCSPALLADKSLATPNDLSHVQLLHDISRRDWSRWLSQTGVTIPNAGQGPIFSHSTMVLQAALLGQGVALGHSLLTRQDIHQGRLVCPFPQILLSNNAYYLATEEGRDGLGKVAAFRDWMISLMREEEQAFKSAI